MLTLSSENPSSEDNFEKKFQANVSPYDQGFEKQEGEFDIVQEREKMEPQIFSLETAKNVVLTLTSENTSSGDKFEKKF